MKVELTLAGGIRFRTRFVFSLFAIIGQVVPRYKSKEVSVALVDDRTIKKLNTRYRHRPMVTDVLSFAERDSVAGPKSKFFLGEIIISYPQARRQAGENKRSVQLEITDLLIHGLLHLVGYDHATDRQAAVMRRYEQKIRKRFLS